MIRALLAACLLAGLAALPAQAQHLDQRTQELRTVLYYHVPEADLARLLPPGWQPASLAAGPAKGANLTVNLSEQLAATTPDGKVAGDARGRALTISARVHNAESNENRAVVLFGVTTGADTPGPYGTHVPGAIALIREAKTGADNATHASERWLVATPGKDRFDLAIGWTRGALVTGHVDQQTRSSVHPDFYRIYKIDSCSDVVRSQSAGVDHSEQVKVSSQGRIAALLKAAGAPTAIISVPVFQREIWLP